MRSVPVALSIILVLLSAVLGWQLYSSQLALNNEASLLAKKDVQLTEATQKLSQQGRDLDRQRQALDEERMQREAATGKASVMLIQRTWHIRSLQNILINDVALRTEPSEDKIRVKVH